MNNDNFRNTVTEVKLAYNIVDYIQQSGIQLRRNGSVKWVGLCPFHNEKTPSFYVDENFQNYRCFGCGDSGDIISFTSKSEKLDFNEALQKLAYDKGIKLKTSSEKTDVNYRLLKEIVRDTALFYHKVFKGLPSEHNAVREITDRGLSLSNIVYGYAPEKRNSLRDFLSSKGYSLEDAHKAGVLGKNKETGDFFDFWSGRLMFIITDITGKPIAFSGRKLFESDKRGKYVNSPDNPIFDKSSALFNISKAKEKASKEKVMYVTEGQFDVAAFVEEGMDNAVASSGTAFTEKQANIIRRLITEDGKIVFCFDSDAAGVKAAIKVFENLPILHSQAYAVSFPENMDPCDYRKENDLSKHVTENAVQLTEFVLEKILLNYDMNNSIERLKYVKKAASVIKTLTNGILKEEYINYVALAAFTTTDNVIKEVEKAERIKSSFFHNDDNVKTVKVTATSDLLDKTTELVDEEIIDYIKNYNEYYISSRIIALALRKKEKFSPLLIKHINLFPNVLHPFIEDLSKSSMNDRIIPELFRQTKLAEYVLGEPLIELEHNMNDDDFINHFKYLFKELKKEMILVNDETVSSKVSKILNDSNNKDIKLLEKALQKEKEMKELVRQKIIR